MALLIRFTEKQPTKGEISYNGFTGEELKGICCFEITETDSMYREIRKIADSEHQYVVNSNRVGYVFEGTIIENNFNGVGVIATVEEIIEKVEFVPTALGYSIK